MIVYSITYAMEENSELEWMEFMKTTHIPKTMELGIFTEYRFTKILPDQGLDIAYNIQYHCASKEELDHFLENLLHKTNEELSTKFAGKFGSFHTLLEVVS